MLEAKLQNSTTINDANADAVAEIINLIAKINNLLTHRDKSEYYLDLLSEEIIERHGRAQLEEAFRSVFNDSFNSSGSASQLSEKFTKLLWVFMSKYGGMLGGRKVKVVHRVEDRPAKDWRDVETIELPISAEPIMVEHLLYEMAFRTIDSRCYDCITNTVNGLQMAGAPIDVEPSMRHMSAEEFIAAATREPITPEEWRRRLLEKHPTNGEVKN